MPIKWTPELDTVLLHGVFEECNISFSKALCQKLADRVKTGGIDCTAKAVENRLYTWKKKNVGSGDGTPKVASTTKPATTPKTPKSRAKKQRLATPESGSPEGLQSESDGLEQDSPLASKKRKRATPKKTVNYKETSGEDESEEQEYIPLQGWRKVKKEPIEDGAVMFGENVEVEQGEEEI